MDDNSQPNSRYATSRHATSSDMVALALYMKGRQLFNDRIHLRTEGLLEALALFRRAIKLDPGFAKAHASIALVYWLLTSYDDSVLLVDALEDPSLAEKIAQKLVSAVGQGNLQKLVGFEALLVLGSPHAFDLNIDPIRDITRTQLHAQIWNNWATALRQDPRFKDWVTALGYVVIWRKYGWPDRCRPTGPDDFECI